MSIPAKTLRRLKTEIPRFQKILIQARERDVNESDTVNIVTDMLGAVFGWDKYEDVVSEYGIKGTYCDLVVKQKGKIEYLLEVKAIGRELHSKHLRQTVDYAAKGGIRWAILTNGIVWQIHRVEVRGKVDYQLLTGFNLLEIDKNKAEDQDKLFLLCKRGLEKDKMGDYYKHRQSINPYMLAAVLQTETMINLVRKEMRKLNPGLKVETEEISSMLVKEVIKHNLIESDEGREALQSVTKSKKKLAKSKERGKQSAQEGIPASSNLPSKSVAPSE